MDILSFNGNSAMVHLLRSPDHQPSKPQPQKYHARHEPAAFSSYEAAHSQHAPGSNRRSVLIAILTPSPLCEKHLDNKKRRLLPLPKYSTEPILFYRRAHSITVGRHRSCDFFVPSLVCSAKHFRINVIIVDEDIDPLVYCEDLGSPTGNGTLLNGKLMERGKGVLLFDGDTIEIQEAVTFKFSQWDPTVRWSENTLPGYSVSDRLLGMGGFGKVYLAIDKNAKQYACKVVQLKGGKGDPRKEVEVLTKLRHPNIVRIHDVCETKTQMIIIQELITHGDLFSLMHSKGRFDEVEAKAMVWQILQALIYLHDRKVVHRDLKPENILCTTAEPGGRVVISDFGGARAFNPASCMDSALGTAEYRAPEILSSSGRGYTQAIDLWALGIIIHLLLLARYPFDFAQGDTDSTIQRKLEEAIRSGNVQQVRQSAGARLSGDAKDFIGRLLNPKPALRLTARQAIKHPWLARKKEDLERYYLHVTAGCEAPAEREVRIRTLSTTLNAAPKQRKRQGSDGDGDPIMSDPQHAYKPYHEPSSLNIIEEDEDEPECASSMVPCPSGNRSLLEAVTRNGRGMMTAKQLNKEMKRMQVERDI